MKLVLAHAVLLKKNNLKSILCSSLTLLIHTCNTDIYKHSFIPRSTIDWNSLPEATVTSKTVDRLKVALLKRDYKNLHAHTVERGINECL
jgi:hypothetical protein